MKITKQIIVSWFWLSRCPH